jgi:predicted TIM-barrel fold metal-dependent hydrolase
MGGLSFRATVPVIDANVGVGNQRDDIALLQTVDEMLAEMDRHGVSRAVIYHRMGEARSATEANERLESIIEGREDSLAPQWVVDSWPDSLQQAKDYRASGRVSSLRLHDSATANVPLTDWIYGELLEWMSSEGIPLWVSFADNDIAALVTLLRAFPGLDTVLVGAHQMHTSSVRPALRILPRARLELSRYEIFGQIELLKEEFGIERLIYGTYYPRYAMGPMLYSLHHQEFSEEELGLVCAGNVNALLGGRWRND